MKKEHINLALAVIHTGLYFMDAGDGRKADFEEAARALRAGELDGDDHANALDCIDYSRSLLLREGAELSARTAEGLYIALVDGAQPGAGAAAVQPEALRESRKPYK